MKWKIWLLSSLGCGNYSKEETIQGRKLYEELRYITYFGESFWSWDPQNPSIYCFLCCISCWPKPKNQIGKLIYFDFCCFCNLKKEETAWPFVFWNGDNNKNKNKEVWHLVISCHKLIQQNKHNTYLDLVQLCVWIANPH